MALVGTQKISFSPLYGPTGSTTYSSTPVTLTRFNQRRTSFDYNNDSDSSSKVCPSILMNTLFHLRTPHPVSRSWAKGSGVLSHCSLLETILCVLSVAIKMSYFQRQS